MVILWLGFAQQCQKSIGFGRCSTTETFFLGAEFRRNVRFSRSPGSFCRIGKAPFSCSKSCLLRLNLLIRSACSGLTGLSGCCRCCCCSKSKNHQIIFQVGEKLPGHRLRPFANDAQATTNQNKWFDLVLAGSFESCSVNSCGRDLLDSWSLRAWLIIQGLMNVYFQFFYLVESKI